MKISKFHNSRLLVVILVLSSLLNACTSFQPVVSNSPEELAETLEVGDRVEVTISNGTEHEFVIKEITTEGIAGDVVTVSFDEITQLKVERIDGDKVKKVTLVVLGVALVVVAINGLTNTTFGAIGFPGP